MSTQIQIKNSFNNNNRAQWNLELFMDTTKAIPNNYKVNNTFFLNYEINYMYKANKDTLYRIAGNFRVELNFTL